jgi:hypothetical protein
MPGRCCLTELSDVSRLLAQRALEIEQMLERAGNRLPHRDRVAKVSVLLEQRHPKPGDRTTAPRVGSSAPVTRLKRLFCPSRCAR